MASRCHISLGSGGTAVPHKWHCSATIRTLWCRGATNWHRGTTNRVLENFLGPF
ncbi:hypothetical protein TorRG33x02_307390 [Trema orientale]|uniref:Uncharacterized protein n=1 Tax=Trema orientale TaxID=63057 RepID=A0A2P5BVG8_TREOI|nr:hypothetical protein TorRG33x02_307390 [Trema orientale]